MFFIRVSFIVLLGWAMPLFASAVSIADKYPSYRYVFSEFGVEDSYIYDDNFERFVLMHEKQIEHFYKYSLKRGKDLLPMMKGYLLEDGLSDLFVYLSIVESGLSISASSPKNAVGLWQFVPATAKYYNLEVCSDVDERCDPVTSTNAAISYLQKLHRQFGKWYLAAMAYNCGEGRLTKAIEDAGSDELSVLLDEERRYLPKETRDYIKKILLVAMIGEGISMDFEPVNKGVLQVEVLGGTRLDTLAMMLEMDSARLKTLNSHFKNGVVPEDKQIYPITIPEEKLIVFYLRYEVPQEAEPIKPYMISHIVVLGETLESIARKYESTAEEIKKVNHLEEEYLTLGQFLVIPVNGKVFVRYSAKK
ncbi:MAG: transglycosylase SLT domain-containing protein [Campylobacterales bacterium]|nr:transglycosylase SLT domain-containing protein [Campylobacterales bacterium]